MREYSKVDLIEDFGRPSRTILPLRGKVNYLCGLYVFDDYFAHKILIENRFDTILHPFPAGLVIELMRSPSSQFRTAINNTSLFYITLDHQDYIINQRGKSVLGNVIKTFENLIPSGAILKEMSGNNASSVKLETYPEMVLTICFNDSGNKSYSFFGLKQMDFELVENFFKMYYQDYYMLTANALKYELENQTPIQNSTLADEIKKLKSLVDSGILSLEEFSKAKEKLLK